MKCGWRTDREQESVTRFSEDVFDSFVACGTHCIADLMSFVLMLPLQGGSLRFDAYVMDLISAFNESQTLSACIDSGTSQEIIGAGLEQ